MIIKGNNGKAPARKRQPVAASSGSKSKSKRSPKSSVSGNSESATAQLDGVVDRTGNATAESEAGDRVLAKTDADSGVSGTVIQPSELENVSKDAFENTKDDRPNDADCGKVNYFAEPDGQLNLLEIDTNEPPEPHDISSNLEAFKIAYSDGKAPESTPKSISQFKVGDRIVCIEQGKDFNKHGSILEFAKSGSIFYEIDNSNISRICSVEQVSSILIKEELEICNQQSDNGNGSICAQELAQDSPTQELNCGDDRPISSVNEMNIAGELSTSDSPADQLPQMLSEAIGDSATQQISLPQAHPVNHSQPKENVSEPKTSETVSQQSLLQLESYNQNLQLLKMSPDFSTALNDQEAISSISPESLSIFPRAGTMQNGNVSGVQHFLLPGCESESLLLRSPGALSSTGAGRPPGKNKLDYQLMNLGLLTNLEVTAPEFLEFSYNLPLGFSNPAETRTALELSQTQAQLSGNLELQAETEPTAIVESPSATPCIGQLPPSDSKELNISSALPALDNIGSFSKDDLLNFAITAHESIAGIERSELELAMRKLNQARIAGTCLAEYKKKCRHGEFGESVSKAKINIRTAQTYMSIAENWNLLAEASRKTLLVDGQTLGINWARDMIAQSKKSLKSAAAPANPDDWRTPNTKEQPIINLVKQALGGQIWCDPCADAGHKVGAAIAYHKNDDGLKDINVWRKTVFINPPFSDPLPWVKKCCFSIARGDCSAAIMLMKAGTLSNQGTGNLIEKYASAVCHWRGRINFLNDEGVAVKGSDFDCVLVYFGDRLDLFKKAFEQRGTITTIQNPYSNVNNKHIAAATVPLVEEAQEAPAVPTAITSVKQEQELMQKELGLRTNGKTLLPDVAVNDRANAERFDPHTVDDRPFAIQVESVEVEDDSKWYEETAIGVVSRTEGFTTNQSAEIINKLLKADFNSRTRATLKKLSKEELADLLRYCDQELDNRK